MSRNYLDVRSRGFRVCTHSEAFTERDRGRHGETRARGRVRDEDDSFHENEPRLANLPE